MAEMDDAEAEVASLLGAAFARRLRLRHGLERAAEMVGLSPKTLQRYEKGEAAPPPKTLVLLAEAAGFSRALLARIQRPLEAHELATGGRLAGEPPASRGALPAEIAAAVLGAAEEAAEILVVTPAPASWEEAGTPRPEDRERAEVLWQRFMSQDRDRRYSLARESSAFRLWSFAERLAHESRIAAADSPQEALELARLALEIARGVCGTSSWRARMESYALPHLGNALRVCNDLHPARAAFGQARALQVHFSPSDPPLLDASRLPDLEASLCREERRYPEALDLHQEALNLAPTEASGPLLLNKAATLEQMGDSERALAALKEAEPHVHANATPRDLWCLLLNTAVCECHLGRPERAAERLPEIQGLADRLGKALDQLRTRWLTARVAAGLGKTDEAIAIVDRVCADFLRSEPPLPIDAALAGLDLALYWLERGDTAAVQKLALPLERIFAAKGIRREALAALRLFCSAARRQAATLEMARQVKAELQRRPSR